VGVRAPSVGAGRQVRAALWDRVAGKGRGSGGGVHAGRIGAGSERCRRLSFTPTRALKARRLLPPPAPAPARSQARPRPRLRLRPAPRRSPPRPAAGPAPSPAMKKLWVKKRFQVRLRGRVAPGGGRKGWAPRREGGSPWLGPGCGGAGASPAPPQPHRGRRARHVPGGRPDLSPKCAAPPRVKDSSPPPPHRPNPATTRRGPHCSPRRTAPTGFFAISFSFASVQPRPQSSACLSPAPPLWSLPSSGDP
jgi:hypothetical protein